MSFAGATPDLPAEGSGADYSDIGANQRTAAATLPFMDSENQTISDAFLSGTRGVKDWLDYRQAAIGAETQREFNIDPAIDPGNAPIDPKEYQKQFGNLGLTFTPDMGHDQAVLLVNHRLDELRREYVLDNSPNGYGAQTARGLTGFAVSAVDPLNVAAAFVPGLGETRAGLLAARFGQTAARIAEGATAGATGMAALQPINYAEAQAYQDHYGPMDAFMNVAFGTVLGGGLHAGAGFLSDALSRAAPETREAALRAAVGQAVEGRDIDVTPVLATDPVFARPDQFGDVTDMVDRPASGTLPDAEPAPITPADIAAAREDVQASRSAGPSEPSLLDTVKSLGGVRTKGAAGARLPEAGDIEAALQDYKRPGLVNNKSGLSPDYMREALTERGWLGRNRDPGETTVNEFLDGIRSEAQGAKVYHPDSSIHADLAYRELLDREANEAGVKSTDTLDAAARKLAEYRASRGAGLADQFQSAADAHAQGYSPEAQEALQSNGYEPGADYGAEFEAGEGDSQRPGDQGFAGGQEPVPAGPSAGAQAPGRAAGGRSLSAEAAVAIERAKQRSLDFAHDQEPSAVEASLELRAQVAAEVRAHLGNDPKAELEDAMTTLQGYKAQGVISDAEFQRFTEANAADADALKTGTEAAKAVARCLFLHP